LWIGAQSALGCPVMVLKLRTAPPLAGSALAREVVHKT
jgi:hypothetical protein